MRTLALLTAALLLLAVQAQAQALRETDDQVPAQDLPEALDQDQLEAKDQNQLEAEDQNEPGAKAQGMAISFGGPNRLIQGASGLHRVTVCYCRRGHCNFYERLSGTCTINGVRQHLCCH